MGLKYSNIRKQLIQKESQWIEEGAAYVTHYWQNRDNGYIDNYKKEAEEYIDNLTNESDFNYGIPFKYDVPFPPPKKPTFKFIDLFAGIGGFRISFQELNGKCMYSSEWNKYAKKTYDANFGEVPFGDITKTDEKKIPDHDILVGGFPCQPFSIAGVSKKKSLGKKHGFLDETQGTLFFDIARIIKEKKPKAFLLENVKNLKSHDNGNTFKVIEKTLKKLGYIVFSKVLDAKYYVPQHRERIFIVGFSKEHFSKNIVFNFPEPLETVQQIRSILEKSVDEKYTLTDNLWEYLQNYAKKHREKGNGFGFGLVDKNAISRTLSARYYKDGSEILIPQGKNENPRRLTPEECKRLMGFPTEFKIKDTGVSDTQLYKQFGNSVAVPVVRAVANSMIQFMANNSKDILQANRMNPSKLANRKIKISQEDSQ
ncbi:MAG: DNA (cytosine-5-)-methyltransferase [Bacteroidales bacterium]|nr:DNA (cytosine-5-)-methyltransferase [Bacteroidales bacterium]